MKKFLLISKKITNYMLLVMAIVYMIMILPMSVFMDYCKYNKFLENIKHNQHIGIVVSKNMTHRAAWRDPSQIRSPASERIIHP